MKRRKFILGTTAAVAAVSIGSFRYYIFSDDSGEVILHPFIEDFLSDEELTDIKKEYLSKQQTSTSLNLNEPEVRRTIIIEDFTQNKVQICNGWVLSDVELEFIAKQ